jgi:AcrR family transcriptional regulator
LARQAATEKRQRRERGSISVDEILNGAFEVAQEVSIDSLSMPLLARHLDVGVTSIYWYFRKKYDLLDAMTDRALGQYDFATPFVEGCDWRESLRNHAHKMRQTFRSNPILCDLILIRGSI